MISRDHFDKIRRHGGTIMLIVDVITLAMMYIFVKATSINITAFIYLLMVLFRLWLTLMISKNNILTSVRRFFTGLGYLCVCIILLWVIVSEGSNDITVQKLIIFIFIAVMLLMWLLISCIANIKVSITANCILAGLLAMVMAILDTVVIALPQDYVLPNMTKEYIAAVHQEGYTVVQLLQLLIRLTFLPLIITSGFGVVLSQIKSYWIEKYNNGNDLEVEESEINKLIRRQARRRR